MVKQHESKKFEFDCRNEAVTVIISHDSGGVEKAPPGTVQAGQYEPVNTLTNRITPNTNC